MNQSVPVAQLYAETEQRLKQTETLLAVSQAVGSTLDLTEILRRTTRELVRALGADVGGAYLLSPSRDKVTALAGYHVPKNLIESLSSPPLLRDHPLIKELRESRQPVYSENSEADPRFDYPLIRVLPHKSILMCAMVLKDQIIGGFAIAWLREAHRFTAEELRLVEGITRQAAIAIENARLVEAERLARERLEASEARYRELFENLADIAYVHDLEGKILAINEAGVRASGYTRQELLGMNIAQLMAPGELGRQLELLRRMIAGERIHGFFTAEFIRKDGTRDVLECSGRLVFKGGVPVALEGVARDITTRRRLEERQAAFVEIMKELAGQDDVERLFSVIGERICHLLGTNSASFCVVDGEELVFRGGYGFDEPLRATRRRKIAESRVGRVVVTGQSYVSPDMTTDPHWRDSTMVTRFGYRAILEVPVVLRGAVIGALAALHKSPRTFSSEDVALLTSVADHVAVALDRANLVGELKARLKETQTLLAVSRAVSSTLDVTEAMRRVARETCRALGADMVGAFLADADRKYLRPIAGYHVPKHLLEAFTNYPIPIKENPTLEEAWEHHRPVYSSDMENNPRIDRETLLRFPQRSTLFVPMIVKGTPIGGLFATWREGQHQFTPEELRVVEGISHQAALAIDNARLFQETERRLREMTGLHEISRAMSTLTDIRETYGHLTRQVAELVGARRCLIALYDRELRAMRGQLPGYRVSEDLVRDIETPEVSKAAMQVVNLRKRGSFIVNTPRDLPAVIQEFMGRHQLESVAAVPLSVEGRVIGVLYAADKLGGFSDSDTRLLEVVANHAAIVMRNAHLYQQLNQAYETLKATQDHLVQSEKLRALGEMAGGVAHDVNNVLAVILGRAHLLLEQVEDPDIQRQLRVIEKAAMDGARTVRRVQEFTRMRRAGAVQAVDLNHVVEEVVEVTRSRWKDEAEA
ncbi:MAG: GAF domain-containing protein, partial [Candidatus Rokubacteria bacterium]|nr:GAF domain-containing protein [Candidatus Rokubacteria bacterium]